MAKFQLTINGKKSTFESEPDQPLLWALRDGLGLKGTKFGCGMALCGACTVHLNGEPVRSCQLPLENIPKNAKITTIEGLAPQGTLHVVQQAWIELQVPQCGYCQSGQIMAAAALLRDTPQPSEEEITQALNGHLCRCGTYDRIRKAVHRAAALLHETATPPKSNRQ